MPGARLPLATETVRVALFTPLLGLTVSQAGAPATAVQFNEPPPLLASPNVWLAGLTPWIALKFKMAGVSTKLGGVSLTERSKLAP